MIALPTISIVTPSYQHARFLEWTLRSVLLQRYPKLEYVVMDGGSTDGTCEILERYQQFLSHVESAPDGGQADAVARGFTHTTGEIMAYLNSDDMLAPGTLELVARTFAENPKIDAIYSNRVFVDDNNSVSSYWILPRHSNWFMKRWDYIPQETCFWRRQIYEAVGGIDPSFQFALDYDLFVRFMERGHMVRLKRFLGAFRQHASSKTTMMGDKAHPEVWRVQKQYGIRPVPRQWVFELALYKWIMRSSRRFAASGSTLPGALGGVGYNYDQVWGGLLNRPADDSKLL